MQIMNKFKRKMRKKQRQIIYGILQMRNNQFDDLFYLFQQIHFQITILIQLDKLQSYMIEFQDWYSFFDTIFAKKNPTINHQFLVMISQTKQTWPSNSALPSLCKCFEELENFILQQRNWSESICTIGQLNKIQLDVSNVLLLLEIEKIYIIKFWNKKRRVQASITHFYALLQLFVGSIIPYDNMTLFQCKAANKLCVRIINLQDLFKQFMKKINEICNYFSDNFFIQESVIIRNFFQNFVAFMQLIPKIKKGKMFHVSQLLKYLMIINPIQISTGLRNKEIILKTTRKLIKLQQREPKKEQLRRIKSQQRKIKKVNDYLNKKRQPKTLKLYQSCSHLQKQKCQQKGQNPKNKNLLIFNFPVWIRRYSIKVKKQSRPKIYIEPLIKVGKGKTSSQVYQNFSPRQSRQRKVSSRNKSATKSSRSLFKSESLNERMGSPIKTLMLMKNHSAIERNPFAQSPFNQEDQMNQNQVENINKIIKQRKKESNIERILLEQRKIFSIKQMCHLKQDQKGNQVPQIDDYETVLKQIQKIIQK